MSEIDFVPDRRDETKVPGEDKRTGMDRRRFYRPSLSLKKKGIVYAAGLFLVVCLVAGLLSLKH